MTKLYIHRYVVIQRGPIVGLDLRPDCPRKGTTRTPVQRKSTRLTFGELGRQQIRDQATSGHRSRVVACMGDRLGIASGGGIINDGSNAATYIHAAFSGPRVVSGSTRGYIEECHSVNQGSSDKAPQSGYTSGYRDVLWLSSQLA